MSSWSRNLSNIWTNGQRITGVVDWDQFGLGSRALDLIALAFDCQHAGDHGPADRLFAQAVSVAGRDGLRCLVSCRALAHLAYLRRDGQHGAVDRAAAVISATLARLRRVYG